VAPLNQFTARGVRVGLGLDEAGINDDRDMFQEMRLVLRLRRVPGMDDVVPTCPEVFRMATSGGAAPWAFRLMRMSNLPHVVRRRGVRA
jgi:5-methylthioadenosine/S-adenosylhomocysteine deaminase